MRTCCMTILAMLPVFGSRQTLASRSRLACMVVRANVKRQVNADLSRPLVAAGRWDNKVVMNRSPSCRSSNASNGEASSQAVNAIEQAQASGLSSSSACTSTGWLLDQLHSKAIFEYSAVSQ